jgi:hypothetical protein
MLGSVLIFRVEIGQMKSPVTFCDAFLHAHLFIYRLPRQQKISDLYVHVIKEMAKSVESLSVTKEQSFIE